MLKATQNIQKISKKMVKKKYDIYHFLTFSNEVEKVKSSGKRIYDGKTVGEKIEINKKYSDTLIIIDEVHNLRDGGTMSQKKENKKS